jgi:hypothetical protein
MPNTEVLQRLSMKVAKLSGVIGSDKGSFVCGFFE